MAERITSKHLEEGISWMNYYVGIEDNAPGAFYLSRDIAGYMILVSDRNKRHGVRAQLAYGLTAKEALCFIEGFKAAYDDRQERKAGKR